MNDPFEAHGLNHLSASQINEYIASPAKWLLRVSGYRDNSGSPAMWRGIAVDKAICKVLDDPSTSDKAAHAIATIEFASRHAEALETQHFDDAKVYKEQIAVAGYLDVALPHYRSLGNPIETQSKVVIDIGLPVPIVGYIDVLYEGVVRDIKTVGRMPSRVPSGTARQLAIYAHATNSIPIVDYVHNTKTTQQVVTMSVPDHKRHWDMAVKAANNMTKLLSISSDIQEIAGLLMPDFDDWRWSAGEKDAARRLWRLNDEERKDNSRSSN
jgi:hypothetical protein